MPFEWDEPKRRANLAKHGLDLARGIDLFDGRSAITYASPRGSELRFVTVGAIAVGVLVAVVWTERGDRVRLISLRRARHEERGQYRARYG